MSKIKTKWVEILTPSTASHWMDKVEEAQLNGDSKALSKAWENYFCSR
jgi:hypothetical protein